MIKMSSAISLSFPYFWYPRIPCAGYQHTELYNENLIRLNDDLNILDVTLDRPIYLHFTFGAPYDENPDESILQHYQQLFPYHFRKYLKNGGEIIHYIISPNLSFEPEHFRVPMFILETSEFKWQQNGNIFKSQIYNITVKIFCTMMPTIDLTNEIKYNNLIRRFTGKCDDELLQIYRQTSNDRIFTECFYANIKRLNEKVASRGGLCCGFNFVVFREDSDNSWLKNFALFPEIKPCFKNKNILGEWCFDYNNFKLMLTCDICVSYIKDKQYKLKIINNEFSYKSDDKKIRENNVSYYITSIREYIFKNIEDECKISDSDRIIIECSLEYILSKISNIINYHIYKKIIIYIIKQLNNNFIKTYILNLQWITKLDLNDSDKINYYFKILLSTNEEIDNIFGKKSDVAKYDLLQYLALSYILNCEILNDINIYKHEHVDSSTIIKI